MWFICRAIEGFYKNNSTERLENQCDLLRRGFEGPAFLLVDDADHARFPDETSFDHKRQIADLDYLTGSQSYAMTSLAEAICRPAARLRVLFRLRSTPIDHRKSVR